MVRALASGSYAAPAFSRKQRRSIPSWCYVKPLQQQHVVVNIPYSALHVSNRSQNLAINVIKPRNATCPRVPWTLTLNCVVSSALLFRKRPVAAEYCSKLALQAAQLFGVLQRRMLACNCRLVPKGDNSLQPRK